MEENKIYHNEDPAMGPLDGVQMKTDCIRTEFTNDKRMPFKQAQTKATITASIENGVLSIRDVQTGIMLAVNLIDAMKICGAACDAYKALCGETENPEDGKTADE